MFVHTVISDGSDEDIGKPLVPPIAAKAQGRNLPHTRRKSSPDPLDIIPYKPSESSLDSRPNHLSPMTSRFELPEDGVHSVRLAHKIRQHKKPRSSNETTTEAELREIIDITDDGDKDDDDHDTIESFEDEPHVPAKSSAITGNSKVSELTAHYEAISRTPHIDFNRKPRMRAADRMKPKVRVCSRSVAVLHF